MNIRKVTGENLSEARKKASLLFNNKYVVLESVESKPGIPAAITVALDSSKIGENLPATKTKKPVHFLKPLLSQVEDLLEKGNKSINKFMENGNGNYTDKEKRSVINDENQISDTPGRPKQTNEGVYFERSNQIYGKKLVQKEKSLKKRYKKNNEYKQDTPTHKPEISHILNKRDTPDIDHHFEQIQQRLLRLEKFTSTIGNELLPDISGNPIFRHLLTKNFSPELLTHWFSDTLLPGGQPELQINQIKKILSEELQPKSPDCESGVYLFSGLAGSDINVLITSLIHYNLKKSPDSCKPVIVSESTSSLIGKNLCGEIPRYTVSSNAEWKQVVSREASDSTYFIETKALPFQLEKIAERWNDYSRIFDGPKKPEHHFVTHALFDPEQIVHQLPANHLFQPDYISFSNVDCCINCPGSLYMYNYYLNSKAGFLHSGLNGRESYTNFQLLSEKIGYWSLKNLKSNDF